MMACSPNNAILDLADSQGHLRRFFVLVRDKDRVELSLNVLLSEESDVQSMSELASRMSKVGNQLTFGEVCQDMFQSDNKTLFSLLCLFNTFL